MEFVVFVRNTAIHIDHAHNDDRLTQSLLLWPHDVRCITPITNQCSPPGRLTVTAVVLATTDKTTDTGGL